MITQAEEQLQEEFDRFIEFGSLLDKRSRKYIVHYLQVKLSLRDTLPTSLDDSYDRYFSRALDRFFEGGLLSELCRDHIRLSAQVAMDILHWLRRAYNKIREKNPFEDEAQRLRVATVMPLRDFVQRNYILTTYLGHQYEREVLDSEFYAYKFEQILQKRSYEALDAPAREEMERVLHDLLAQWDALLSAKLLKHQLEVLEEEQESFSELLESKAQEFHKLQSLLSPFADYAGRFWDLSRELWQEADFDLLARYQDLLEKEDAVRQLVDMLGRMREAEVITEEETYEKTIVRKQWIEDVQSRAELTGIHESNDLSSLLSSEVSLLSHPDTETAFLKKYAEGALLTFRYEDRQLVTSEHHFTEVSQRVKLKEKGPFIVCVDTSDSMRGDAEQVAKVICFAIMKMAASENRRAYLINFSVGIRTIDLHDVASSLDAIADFLRMSFRGGTDITLALHEVIRQLQGSTYRDADVLVISDFIMYRIEEDILSRVRHYQQNQGVKFHSLTLCDDPNAEVIEQFDTHWVYDPARREIVQELAGKLRGIVKR